MLNTKTLVLDFDDFHHLSPENCIGQVKNIAKLFPSVKILLFTIPRLRNIPLKDNQEWCNDVRNLINSGTIQLGVHGLDHSPEEFRYLSKEQAIDKLLVAHQIFEEANLPYVKVFKGPHWGLGKGTLEALEELKYTCVFSHEDYTQLHKETNLPIVIYNWNLKDEPENIDVLYGHGHTHNVCGNGFEEIFHRLVLFLSLNKVTHKFPEELL